MTRFDNNVVLYAFHIFLISFFYLIKTVNLVKDCHKSILINYPDFSKALVKLDTLHITLFAMHLKDLNHLEE